MESIYAKIDDRSYCKRTQLLAWDVTALLERGKYLPLLYAWTVRKFGCSANFAVSGKSKNIATITQDGELTIMCVKDETLVVKSQVRVLLDAYPEFRHLAWNQSESLLFATRSSAVVDVFESGGMFLYKIPLSEETESSSQIISHLQAHQLDDDSAFTDEVFLLQINGTFSSFLVGPDGYHRHIRAVIGDAPVSSFAYIPRYHLLVSSTEYQRQLFSDVDIDCASFGLSLHRVLPDFPYVDCLKKAEVKRAWHEKIPFLSQKHACVTCIEVNPEESSLVAITNVGDVLWLSLPSMRLIRFASAEQNDENAVPVQIQWISPKEFVILHSNGQITRAEPAAYFDGLTVDPPLNQIPDCKRILAMSDSTIYALTENRTDQIHKPRDGHPKRVGAEFSLFFWFYVAFIVKCIRALFASFFGANPAEELNEKVGVEQSAQLALYTTKTITLAEYIEIQLAKHEYQVAIDLAHSSNGEYEVDLVYKRQWRDVKKERRINVDDLKVLSNVKDTDWLVNECLQFDSPGHNINHHVLMVELAKRVVTMRDVTDIILMERIQNAETVISVLGQLKKHENDALELYLEHRSQSLHAFAFAMAEEAQFDVLEQLFRNYLNQLRNYVLVVLSAVPESAPPKQYQTLIPAIKSEDTNHALIHLDQSTHYATPEKHRVPVKFDEFLKFLYTSDSSETEVTQEWLKLRVTLMDQCSGLPDDIVSLLEIAIQNGFEDLVSLGRSYALYGDFVRFTGAVHLTFDQLRQWTTPKAREHLQKHLSKKELIDYFERVVELLEFVDNGRGELQTEVMDLVRQHCKKDFDLLDTVRAVCPTYLTNDQLANCFMSSEVRGAELTDAMRRFHFHPGLVEVLELCTMLNDYHPTYAQIEQASREKNKALDLCQRFVKSACVHQRNAAESDEVLSAEWWRDLIFRARRLRNAAFADLVADEQILQAVLHEMVDCAVHDPSPAKKPYQCAPFHLVVDLTGTAESAKLSLLKQSEFERILVEQSKEFVDNAESKLSDPNLLKAELVLDCLLVGKPAPRRLVLQKRHLGVIRTALEMGSRRALSTFQYCEAQLILEETVLVGENYKDFKACGELAKKLDLPTPQATALAACASAALQKEDRHTLRSYVRELAKRARDFPAVYKMAHQLLTKAPAGLDPDLTEDAIACLIHNSPDDQLQEAFHVLDKLRNQQTVGKSIFTEEDNQDFPDLNYSRLIDLQRFQNNHQGSTNAFPSCSMQFLLIMALQGDQESLKAVKKSSTLAELFEALEYLKTIDVPSSVITRLTTSTLRKIAAKAYAQTIKEENADPWNDWEAGEAVDRQPDDPPKQTIKKSGSFQLALERILLTGCDRERFFEDQVYRNETLEGLAITADQEQLRDVEVVAQHFATPLWPIYMTYLEFVLTEPEVSFREAKHLLLQRSDIQQVLFQKPEELRDALRQRVVPLIDPDDIERLTLVETYFPDG